MKPQGVENATEKAQNATKLANKISNGKAKVAKERGMNEKLEEAELGGKGNDVLPDGAAAGSNSLSPRTAPGRTDLTILFILIYILPPMNALLAVDLNQFWRITFCWQVFSPPWAKLQRLLPTR